LIIDTSLLSDWGRLIVRECETVAAESGSVPYLVGGPVRDLLRGVPVSDLDVAVIGHEDAFAAELGRRLGARIVGNDRFLTWRLEADGEHHVDLARARTETYSRPGALPTVRATGSIEEDLARRDFTINAMALRLTDRALVDPFSGRADLDTGRVRVLHDASFLDDPTRIFRAVRLAQRCGFTIDGPTSNLIDQALAGNVLSTISRERIWKEIDLAVVEAKPVPVFRALDARGCFDLILGVRTTGNFEDMPDELQIPDALDSRIVLTGALLRGAPAQAFDRLPWDRTTNAGIQAIATRTPSLACSLASAKDEESLFAACESASPEERFLAGVEDANAGAVATRFENASRMTAALRGNELGVPSGPWIGRALRETRLALFSGRIAEMDAPSFASRLAIQYLND